VTLPRTSLHRILSHSRRVPGHDGHDDDRSARKGWGADHVWQPASHRPPSRTPPHGCRSRIASHACRSAACVCDSIHLRSLLHPLHFTFPTASAPSPPFFPTLISAMALPSSRIPAVELRLNDPASSAPPSHAPLASFARLAAIEVQLVMQHCDQRSLISLARCSRLTFEAASHPFAWRGASPVIVDVFRSLRLLRQTPPRLCSLAVLDSSIRRLLRHPP
jgi:hypothetical protein